MITIEQLLESVDLDFEPGWVTKDEDGNVHICDFHKPEPDGVMWDLPIEANYDCFGKIKLAEFADKDWTECIYEVPRKTTGKIKKIDLPDKVYIDSLADFCLVCNKIIKKQNEFVDVVNALIESNNIHEKFAPYRREPPLT